MTKHKKILSAIVFILIVVCFIQLKSFFSSLNDYYQSRERAISSYGVFKRNVEDICAGKTIKLSDLSYAYADFYTNYMKLGLFIEKGSFLFTNAIGLDDSITSEYLYNVKTSSNEVYCLSVDMIYQRSASENALKQLQTKNENELEAILGEL